MNFHEFSMQQISYRKIFIDSFKQLIKNRNAILIGFIIVCFVLIILNIPLTLTIFMQISVDSDVFDGNDLIIIIFGELELSNLDSPSTERIFRVIKFIWWMLFIIISSPLIS